MYLDPNGYLGVGESSPQARLDVVDNAVIGNISIGAESSDQAASSIYAGDGFLTTPWLYTNAIEAASERGTGSTLIAVGNDGNYGTNDEINFVTGGNKRVEIGSNGQVLIGSVGSSNAVLTLGDDDGDLNSGLQFTTSTSDDWYVYQNTTFDLVFRDDGTERVAFTSGGNITLSGSTIHTSDKRLKTDIQVLEGVLPKVLQLKGVTHYWDTLNHPNRGFVSDRVIGVIAQDIQKVYPELVHTDKDGFLAVDYTKFSAVLLQAIKEQQQLIDRQNQNNEKQQYQIDNLMEEIRLLTKKIEKNE